MRQQTSPAIVLRRTNYGEADRVVTFLTPIGKVKAIVKGVISNGLDLETVKKFPFPIVIHNFIENSI